MKKSTKFLLTLAAMTTVGFGASAQDLKECNLEIQLTSPANDAVYEYGDTIWISFDVKNNGPDAITATDTLWVGVPSGQQTQVFPVTTSGIASGVTAPVSKALRAINTNEQGEDVVGSYCLMLVSQANVTRNGEPVTETYVDEDTTNHVSCNANITFKAKSVSIRDIAKGESLSIYPNPASSVINLNMTLDKAESVIAIVRDIAGREVLRQDFGTVQSGNTTPFTLNVSNLNSGLYLVELNAGERKAIGKVTVK